MENVLRGLKVVCPKLNKFLNYKKYEKNLEAVENFLIEFRNSHYKSLFEMSVDYFTALEDYYRHTLKLNGFRLSLISSDLAKKVYEEYVFGRGSLYWDENVKAVVENKQLPISIEICREINLLELKNEMRMKYDI